MKDFFIKCWLIIYVMLTATIDLRYGVVRIFTQHLHYIIFLCGDEWLLIVMLGLPKENIDEQDTCSNEHGVCPMPL